MATVNYDEVTYAATSQANVDGNTLDPLYKYHTHFPERLSRLNFHDEFSPGGAVARRQKRGRQRQCARFKTQPITFDEIKEVDEEDDAKTKENLKNQFMDFSRSVDGLLPLPSGSRCNTMTNSPLTAKGATSDGASSSEDLGRSQEELGHSDGVASDASPSSSTFVLPTGLPQFDQSRTRRNKRRAKRSIEELPELEKEASDTQAG